MHDNHTTAKKLAFERIPETCPHLRQGSTDAIAKMSHWLDGRPWMDKLTEKEKIALEKRVALMASDIVDHAQETGTKPLRAAFIREIEENLVSHPTNNASEL